MEVFLIKCWRRPTYFIVKKNKNGWDVYRARLDVNAYVCGWEVSFFWQAFLHLSAVLPYQGCRSYFWASSCDADPTRAAYFYCLSRLGQNPRHQAWPHYNLFSPPSGLGNFFFIYFFLILFPPDLHHLADIYSPCCFLLARESVSHHKRLCWPSGAAGEMRKDVDSKRCHL